MLEITDAEFNAIKDIMFKKTGVFLKPTKKPLVITRLRKRIQELGLSDFSEYITLLSDPKQDELEYFVNALTTNETFFFRHDKQFDYLKETIIPALVQEKKQAGKVPELRVWSAASSTGEEVYSIAILLKECMKTYPGLRVTLIASDVNSVVLERARAGIYPGRSLREVPEHIKKKYFTPCPKKNEYAHEEFEIAHEIKTMVTFQQHNLLRLFSQKNFDVIFLRNVLIYFTRETKETVVKLLANNSVPGGYLFISLSESLSDVTTPFTFLQSGIYQQVR